MPLLHVIVPAYNERSTLEPCLRRVIDAPLPEKWERQVIVIDDCSDQEAALHAEDVTNRLRDAGARIRLLRHQTNRGKGAALQSGFDHVLDQYSDSGHRDDLVIIQDADLEYDPNDYTALMTPLIRSQADAVLGTRWGEHRPVKGFTARIHAAGNHLLTVMSNAVTGYRVRDMECCYKVFPIHILRTIRPWLSEARFGIEPQMVAALARSKARVTEVPVAYAPRGFSDGKKIGIRDGIRAVWVILRERLRRQPSQPSRIASGTVEVSR